MRRPWSALGLAAGGLLLLASLYLPWAAAKPKAEDGPASGVLHLFSDEDVGAWSASASTATAVVALYLVAAGMTAWMRAPRAVRIPISAPAVLSAYFALAIAVEARAAAANVGGGGPTIDIVYARGAYLGVAAGLISVGSAFALRRSALGRTRRPRVLGLLGTGVAIALASALLLPWEHATFRFEGVAGSVEYPGISEPASVGAAVAAVWLATMFWTDRRDAGWTRVLLASAGLLFTLGAFSAADPVLNRTYGAWIALGAAFALLPVAILHEGRVRLAWVKRLRWRELALAAAAALLVGSLFLPWQEASFPRSFAPDPRAGHSVSLNGWILTGTAAAGLATGLLALALRRRRNPVHPLALAAGVLLFATATAVELTRGSTREVPFELGYGAFIGLACAAVAIALAVPRLSVAALDWREIGAGSVPVALCVAYIAILVVPPLFEPSLDRPALFFAPISWLTIAGAVVAIHLVQCWVEQSADRGWLVLLPLGMLSLALVDVIRLRNDLAWGAAAVLALCTALVGLGRIRQGGGLSSLRIPEVLRVDRI